MKRTVRRLAVLIRFLKTNLGELLSQVAHGKPDRIFWNIGCWFSVAVALSPYPICEHKKGGTCDI